MKNPILTQVFAGMRLQLHAFGGSMVRRLYVHTETKELVAEIKSDGGETMHLSMKYVERLMS